MAARKLFGVFHLPNNVKLHVLLANIVQTKAECVVNAANQSLEGGDGLDGAIHEAAGPSLLHACRLLPFIDPGLRCHTGEAKLTPGPFCAALAAPNVIQVVGPDLRTGLDVARAQSLLSSAICSALTIAKLSGFTSLAIPAVSCGNYSNNDQAWTAIAPSLILRGCLDFASDTDAANKLTLILLVSLDPSHCLSWCTAAAEWGLATLAIAPRSMHAIFSPAGAAATAAANPAELYGGLSSGPAFTLPAAMRGDTGPLCSFLAIGDWGDMDMRLTSRLAANMSAWSTAQSGPPPDFILALGDNFYSSGVSSVDDSAFEKRWAQVFVEPYERLQVPWCVILGNHDHMGSPTAQVDYTRVDPRGLWRMPAFSYSFKCGEVYLFGLDTSGVQFAVQRKDADARARLSSDIASLTDALATTKTVYPKVVFGHHALYTKGIGHGAEAQCLRLPAYSFRGRSGLPSADLTSSIGFNLEHVLALGGATAFLHGHEHVLQAHPAPSSGVASFCFGSSGGKSGFYKGENNRADAAEHWPEWVDRTGSAGFAQVDVWPDSITVTFVGCSAVGAEPRPIVLRVDTVPIPSPTTRKVSCSVL
jgi:O-acetyl-ADP-ribose deacetylase (regulator of RNase III)